MNITQEILEHFGVRKIKLKTDSRDILAVLREQNQDLWTFTTAEEINFLHGDKIYISILLADSQPSFSATVEASGTNWITVKLPPSVFDTDINDFIQNLRKLEYNDEKYGRRKEKRFAVGTKNAKLLGLKNPQQSVIIGKIKLPCVIADISMHGIQIIIPFDSLFVRQKLGKSIGNFTVILDFLVNSTILISVHKVQLKLTSTKTRTFANISCQILEPIPYAYKEVIIQFIKKLSSLEFKNSKIKEIEYER